MNNINIMTWNVSSLRSIIKKKVFEGLTFQEFIHTQSIDFLCLNETKINTPFDNSFQFPFTFWNCSSIKKGYSGTAILTKHKPLHYRYGFTDTNKDPEGRVITLEYKTFYIVNCYTPNSGEKLKRLEERTDIWDVSFRNYVKDLNVLKPVIICGDLNCAHKNIDLKNPGTNHHSAGFTIEERNNFSKLLDVGFLDTFRFKHPLIEKYSYWNYRTKARERNTGWRIDYHLISNKLKKNIIMSDILTDIYGSDHAPIFLQLKKI